MYVYIEGPGLYDQWSFHQVKHACKVKGGIQLEFTDNSKQEPYLLKGKYLRIVEINNYGSTPKV